MSRRPRPPRGGFNRPPADEALGPDWTVPEQAPWPGDDPAEDPRNERLAREEDISAETGEKFARYAALAVLVPIVLFVIAIMCVFLWDLVVWAGHLL